MFHYLLNYLYLKKAQQCLDGVANIEEEISMANQIIDGVSHYFPKMKMPEL